MCQGFGHFSVFLHHFELAKLSTSSVRVLESELFHNRSVKTSIFELGSSSLGQADSG